MIIIVKSVYGQISFEFNPHQPSTPSPVTLAAPNPTSTTSPPPSGEKKPQLREETNDLWIAPWLRTIPPKK